MADLLFYPGHRQSLHPLYRLERVLRIAVAFGLALTAGCATMRDLSLPGWVADYDTAEARARESNRELLIFFKDTRPGMDDRTWEALNSRELKQSLRDYVCCRLFRTYEPDRRFVAQYGVERAPALILVHRDGTYHTRASGMSAGKIAQFLAESKPPGKEPVINPYIPRRVEYGWHRSLESAEAVAMQTGQPMLVVFHRRLTRDWARLGKLLSSREVHSRLAEMVHCRVGVFPPWTKACTTRFGRLRLPSLVIVERDGAHHVLEMPTSCEAVIRFADRVVRPAGKPAAQAFGVDAAR